MQRPSERAIRALSKLRRTKQIAYWMTNLLIGMKARYNGHSIRG